MAVVWVVERMKNKQFLSNQFSKERMIYLLNLNIMKRILVAEDNRLILETVAHSLSREGYDIIKATDGKECMAKLEGNQVDLIITDLYMPNLNGLELISQLNDNYKNLIPIMVLSAGGAEENVLKAFEIGADDFMVKPFSLIELNVRVRKLLELKK